MTDDTRISPTQKAVHVAAEAIALFVVTPLLLYAATRDRELSKVEKGALATVAIGTLIVDSWLLHRFTRDRRH